MRMKMKRFGIISYNRYCNFTNYGSALQSWALYTTINKIGQGEWEAILVDYCPDAHLNSNPLNPIEDMMDVDEESRKMCELSLPAIEINFYKFEEFYDNYFIKTKEKYTSSNLNEIVNEEMDGFVCGSDTIFCIDEFGFDEGYYANIPCMKNGYSVSYAASFGDSHFTEDSLHKLNDFLQNFNYITLRETDMLNYVNDNTLVPVKRVLDPTLLLTSNDYNQIAAPKQETKKYLLIYTRRYDEDMHTFAEKFAKENGWDVIEISLRATNAEKHRMYYEAGVEEFLSLVKNAEFVVTNSFHGFIFSVVYKKQFFVFSREWANTKIFELASLIGLTDRLIEKGSEIIDSKIDYDNVFNILDFEREKSIRILKEELMNCK